MPRPVFYKFYPEDVPNQQAFNLSLTALIGSSIQQGNHIESFQNGHAFFPVLRKHIQEAQNSINFETFAYWGGKIGEDIAGDLMQAAKRGVECNLVLDGFGARTLKQKEIKDMKKAGVRVHFFRPLKWTNFWRLRWHNHRTHRKLIIIDGHTGYIGGMGIADSWVGDGDQPNQWRDTHHRVQGPIVLKLQGVFLDNWTILTGEVLRNKKYFPGPLEEKGDVPMQLVKSFPSDGCSNMRLTVLSLVHYAKKSICITTPYFLPDRNLRYALKEAVERGVDVKILTSFKHNDKAIVARASQFFWADLLKDGIQIFTFTPTFIHKKEWIIDDQMVSVGSSNIDYRSIYSNYEANITLYSSTVAKQMRKVFDQDLDQSSQVQLKEMKNLSTQDRMINWVCARLRYLL
jgi:cardiolipin synthase